MEQNLETKLEFKQKLLNFYNNNKIKIYFFLAMLVVGSLLAIYLIHDNEKKKNLIAEKYVQAGLYLTSNKEDKATQIYEEIIQSKNQFYSVLALNTILENNLIKNKNQILNYFNILEKNISDKELNDLITLKKALYLIKNSNNQEGLMLLKNLIKKNSNLKFIAQEIVKN
tara:strand:- start:3470 stop:3979 length:510 start_codon:yes stop_codon:yes gene_type:complete